ncbi:MAG TPA: PP2C family serine/threonine-protein phosphatase [Candidatus Acidoferrales bacterium]|nr:PP2C family serine/threonine-protein phosphatase [Candidatus Acidoferrales bacterium]
MTATDAVEIESHSLSHVGKVRRDNQDAVRLCDPNDKLSATSGHLYGIADGMGGYAHGGVASSLALQTFFETFYAANGVPTLQKFRVSIQNANLSVYQTAQRMAAGRMGTTLTTANIIGKKIYIGHVGDSRAYLVRGSKATLLTNDHTRVGELVRMRVLAPEKVRTHSQRSILEKCLGLNLFVQPDIFQVPVENGDTIILCTDGIWSVIEDEEFGRFSKESKSVERLSQRIFDLAMERESDDNLSIIALRLNNLATYKETEAGKRPWSLQRLFRLTGR